MLRISGESEGGVLRISGENFSKSGLPVDKVAVGSPRSNFLRVDGPINPSGERVRASAAGVAA